MNRLSRDKRKQVVAALIEGCSIRSVCRMTGAANGTVLRLLVDLDRDPDPARLKRALEYWGVKTKAKPARERPHGGDR